MIFKYHVIHIDEIEQRNESVRKIRDVMSNEGVDDLGAEIANLKNFDMAHDFIARNPGFVFNFHSEFEKPFPHVSGVVGCWASHYLAWKKMLIDGVDALVIFEDDVYINDDFMKYVELYLQNLPDDWDFFSISIPDGEENRYSQDRHYIGNDLVCRFYQAWNTGAYIVSRRGALKAIKDISKNGISVPIDWYIFESGIGKLNTYNPMPHIKKTIMFDEDFTNSYIGKTEERYYE